MNSQEPTWTKPRFFRFGLRQLFVLFAVLGVLLAILAPRFQRAFRERQFQNTYRRVQQAQKDLHTAICNNDLNVARRALKSGAGPNQIPGGGSLLHRCIAMGNVSMLELLLDSGADVEYRGQFQTHIGAGPPLHAAVAGSQPVRVRLDMIRLLVRHGADIRSEAGQRNAMDLAVYQSDAAVGDLLRENGLPYGPREMAAFNRLDELATAVKENPGLLRQRYRPVYAGPKEGPTLLGLSSERGYRLMAKFLIDSGAPLDTVEKLGLTPLHLAAHAGDPELIRMLVARGADVNARDQYQDTPLRDIAGTGRPEAVAALIESGADVNARGMFQSTPLHGAIGNCAETVRLLLAAGADPTIPDRNGVTPLDVAREKNLPMLKLLEEALADRKRPSGR